MTVGLFNESFPPIIDGVANVVKNYAYWINKKKGQSIVVTPKYPKAVDDYSFEVSRYLSMKVPTRKEYRFGIPILDSVIWRKLKATNFDIVHAHSPFGAGLAAKQIAKIQKIPVVATFHTKYRDDFQAALKSEKIVNAVVQRIVEFYESVDEVWVVNEASAQTLREYGYGGEYHIMENGCDIKKQFPSPKFDDEVNRKYLIENDVPLFLFVGQHIWQKNVKLVIDALKILKDSGAVFHMMFVGDGPNRKEMEQMVESFGLSGNVTFAGKIYDRNAISKIYLRSSALLFPSLYDTDALVKREAAACGCPTVFVKGSNAAQEINERNGFFIDNRAEDLAGTAKFIIENRESAKQIGKFARETVYRGWEDSVNMALKRYRYLIDWKKSKDKPHSGS